MSIRERISEIGSQMLKGDPTPADCRRHEVMLSGLLSHVNKAVTGAEVAYKRKVAELRKEAKSAADAKLQAEATAEYEDWREAVGAQSSCLEMLRTLRSTQRSQSEEARLQR